MTAAPRLSLFRSRTRAHFFSANAITLVCGSEWVCVRRRDRCRPCAHTGQLEPQRQWSEQAFPFHRSVVENAQCPPYLRLKGTKRKNKEQCPAKKHVFFQFCKVSQSALAYDDAHSNIVHPWLLWANILQHYIHRGGHSGALCEKLSLWKELSSTGFSSGQWNEKGWTGIWVWPAVTNGDRGVLWPWLSPLCSPVFEPQVELERLWQLTSKSAVDSVQQRDTHFSLLPLAGSPLQRRAVCCLELTVSHFYTVCDWALPLLTAHLTRENGRTCCCGAS